LVGVGVATSRVTKGDVFAPTTIIYTFEARPSPLLRLIVSGKKTKPFKGLNGLVGVIWTEHVPPQSARRDIDACAISLSLMMEKIPS
jgi:hypothetical protein